MRRIPIPITIFSVLILLVLTTTMATAQSFEEALDRYEEESYREALVLLESLRNEDRVLLLKGKSYLALGAYTDADYYLVQASKSDLETISNDALYSLAVNKFRTRDMRGALEILLAIRNVQRPSGLQEEIRNFYRDLLGFLTEKQRYQAFWQTDNETLRLDLVRSALDRGSAYMASAMLSTLEHQETSSYDSSDLQSLRQRVDRISATDSEGFSYPVPEGMIYHIGVALPAGGPEDPGASVARNLYSGLMIAAEEFNSRHNDRKVFLHFKNTSAGRDSTQRVFHELIWRNHVDVIVGPLFSDSAEIASRLAERYEIPVITPLANSDGINEGNHYLFQINPTFSYHGRRMARFAVQELAMDTLAVITQQNSLGRSSALAFRAEAERLGAHVAYMIEDDFASAGYDLSEFTEVLNPDPEIVDSLGLVRVDGIYAPFTGQEAETLVNQLLTNLEWMQSQAVVMGSEEWATLRLTDEQQRAFPIWYSQSYSETGDRDRIAHFREDFSTRFGRDPDTFARIGYDTGQFLFSALEEAGNPQMLNRALRNAPSYRGLSMDIHFDGEQINRHVQLVPANDRARQLLNQLPDSR